MTTAMNILVLVLSVCMFFYMIHTIERDHEKRYNRMLNERREFGYRIENPNDRTYSHPAED